MRGYTTYYLALYQGKVMVTDDVSYYGGKTYICKDKTDANTIWAVEGSSLIKLTEETLQLLFSKLIRADHSNVVFEIDSVLPSDRKITLNISKGGFCKVGDTFFRFDLPKNIMRSEYVRVDTISENNFTVASCDRYGHILDQIPSRRVGYSKRCNILLAVIRENPDVDTRTLYSYLGWDGCQLAPRLSELSQAGRIVCTGKIYNGESNRKYSQWRAIDDN